MAPASMTESPIAVTCRPETLQGGGDAEGGGGGEAVIAGPAADGDPCARAAVLTRSPWRIWFSMPDGPEGAWNMPYPAVQVTARAAAAHSTGRARTGERRAAETALPSALPTVRQVARKPFRRTGSSSHFHEAAANVIAMAASTAHAQGAPRPGPAIAAAIAITGQCHR